MLKIYETYPILQAARSFQEQSLLDFYRIATHLTLEGEASPLFASSKENVSWLTAIVRAPRS